jgi:hypothetical protein
MKKLKPATLFLIAIVFITACSYTPSGQTNNKGVVKDSILNNDTSFLADKNFVFKNLTNTNNIVAVHKSIVRGMLDSVLYADTTFTKHYTPLSAQQCAKFVTPVVSKMLGVSVNYVRDLMHIWFVSKQNKVGDLQPLVVSLEGKDYSSFIMIILDKYNKPVQGLILNENSGPTNYDGSTNWVSHKIYSQINNNEITTYHVNETSHTYPAKSQIIVDSTVFKSLISKGGNILTKQVVKARFKKTSK